MLRKKYRKYISFSVPITKEVANDDGGKKEEQDEDVDDGKKKKEKDDDDGTKKKRITYKLNFIDSYRFMPCKLSDLVDNLLRIHKRECKSCMKDKKLRQKCEFIGFKNNRLNYICKKCKTRYTKSPNEAIKKFPILYRFCNGDLDKFLLLLGKGYYPYEYMDSWEKFDKT